jgi:hypothetical protein
LSRKMNSNSSFPILRILLIVGFILLAAAVRILPHPWNFTPIGAMALFSGAKLTNKWTAFLIPLSALFLGDLFIGFHQLMLIVYLSFCASVLIGRYFRNHQTILPLSVATLLGAIQFFLITNLAVWAYGYTTYAKSFSGLLSCYVDGIPFFANTLAGDAVYAVALFGGFALAERLNPALSRSRLWHSHS